MGEPTLVPTASPTNSATSKAPTALPTSEPTLVPTASPSNSATSKAPTASPTSVPTNSGDNCRDSNSFQYQGKIKKNCKWVGRGKKTKNHKRKCKKKQDGKHIWDWCPFTCGK